MKVIGITGGVGSGKSSVLEILEQEYGALVIQADLVAKKLMEPGEPGYLKLVTNLGTGILAEDKTIDRKSLSDLMFHEKNVLQTVNSIIHPMVWKEIKDRIYEGEADLVVVEAALADENISDIYDELWYLYTSEENRISRLLASRGYTMEKTRSMMAGQPSEETFRSLADRVIDNNGSPVETKQQLQAILKNEGQS